MGFKTGMSSALQIQYLVCFCSMKLYTCGAARHAVICLYKNAHISVSIYATAKNRAPLKS